ncbi:tyrosine-type recombinase/integrase [Umezawaea sp. Da 62-37]|nr:tyrosine-type recombinase/integrase [Umezawaea sp. Da 62-37]WNV92020.1 tyrosine-type recombinase/integrase [Umezawaea sp. Da 62-37]
MLVHTQRRGIDVDGYSPIALKPVRAIPKTLTSNEVARVRAACQRARERFWVTLLDQTGLRRGEALGLRHEDLRLRAGEVHVVPREFNVNEAQVKGLKARTVPIGPAVLDSYADYMEIEYSTLDSDYVFVNLFGSSASYGAPMTRDNVKDITSRLRRRSGVAHYSSHVLRHTYATRLLRAKVPVEVVSELLGHNSVQTTWDIYGHLTMEDHRRTLVQAGVLAGVN